MYYQVYRTVPFQILHQGRGVLVPVMLVLGLDTKSLVLSLKVIFVWVSELRWKLSGHEFLLLHYYSTGARTTYTKLHWFWPRWFVVGQSLAHASVQPTLSFTGAHSCTPATSTIVERIFSQWTTDDAPTSCAHEWLGGWYTCLFEGQWLCLLTLLVWTYNADWKLLVMERFRHNDRSNILCIFLSVSIKYSTVKAVSLES